MRTATPQRNATFRNENSLISRKHTAKRTHFQTMKEDDEGWWQWTMTMTMTMTGQWWGQGQGQYEDEDEDKYGQWRVHPPITTQQPTRQLTMATHNNQIVHRRRGWKMVQMDNQTNKRTNEWMNERTNGWTNEWMNKQTNKQTNKWMNGWSNERMNKWTNKQ